jgi:hypothetical protein
MEGYVEKFKSSGLGSQIILVAALVLFIDGFLKWYSVSVEFAGFKASASANGWEAPGAIWSILAILIGVAMAGIILVRALAKEGTLPENISGITWPRIMLGAGVAACVAVLIKLINHSGDLAFGFFIGIICVVALAVGGYLMFQQEQKSAA